MESVRCNGRGSKSSSCSNAAAALGQRNLPSRLDVHNNNRTGSNGDCECPDTDPANPIPSTFPQPERQLGDMPQRRVSGMAGCMHHDHGLALTNPEFSWRTIAGHGRIAL